jgi:hypothetical protein
MGTKLRFFGLLVVGASALSAASLCTSGTLQQYINLGAGGCQVGNTLFSGFNYIYTQPLFSVPSLGTDTNLNVSASQVTVTVSGPADSPTFTFAGDWSMGGGFQSEVEVDFTACALNLSNACAPSAFSPLQGSVVSFTGTVEDLRASSNDFPSNINTNLSVLPVGGSLVSLTPSLYPSACATPQSGCPTDIHTGTVSASASLGAVQQISVSDKFFLDSGGTSTGSHNVAVLSQFSQTISDAPEPATFAAVGLGILTCGVMAFRKPPSRK